jgi:hypothetical protein
MNVEVGKIQKALDHLWYELDTGLLMLSVVQAIHNQIYSKGTDGCLPQFFYATYLACLHQSILTLSKLVSHDGDSTTIQYLLNLAEATPNVFPEATCEQVLASVNNCRSALDGLSPTIDNVKKHRDKKIAHLDRAHINDPEKMRAMAIYMPDIVACYEKVAEVLNELQTRLNATPRLINYQKQVDRELEFMLEALEQRQFPCALE